MANKLVHFRELEDIVDSLDGIAKRRGTNRGSIIREAIRKYLELID